MGISDATSSKATWADRAPEPPSDTSPHPVPLRRAWPALLAVGTGIAAVFLWDWWLPHGWAPWLFYVPLCLALLRFTCARYALIGAVVCSGLVVAGFFLDHGAGTVANGMFNRSVGLVALWVAVLAGRAYARTLAEHAARLSEQQRRLQAVVDTAVEGIITIDERGVVDSMNPAAEKIFGYRADEVIGRNVNLLMPSPYREQHDGYIARYLRTGEAKIIGIGREVVGLRKDGTIFPLDLSVSEVKLDARRIFTALLRDLTERKRLEAAVTSATEQERGRIARDLHDGLGQELGGALFLSNLLQRDLREHTAPEAERAAQIHALIEKALADARDLARGLYPVPPEPDGLMTALENLADRVTRDCHIDCSFDADSAVLLDDPTVATHLYRIAQEAVNNALKHSGAVRIEMRLAATAHTVEVSVRDHGAGLRMEPPAGGGLGLQTMKQRAQLIGGRLTVQNVSDGTGALVSCSVMRFGDRAREAAFEGGML